MGSTLKTGPTRPGFPLNVLAIGRFLVGRLATALPGTLGRAKDYSDGNADRDIAAVAVTIRIVQREPCPSSVPAQSHLQQPTAQQRHGFTTGDTETFTNLIDGATVVNSQDHRPLLGLRQAAEDRVRAPPSPGTTLIPGRPGPSISGVFALVGHVLAGQAQHPGQAAAR